MMWKTVVIFLWISAVSSVDRSKFKTCSQSGFCKRCRGLEPGKTPFVVQPESLHVSATAVESLLVNTANGVKFKVELFGLVDNTFRKNTFQPPLFFLLITIVLKGTGTLSMRK
jgi:hypothetical protein